MYGFVILYNQYIIWGDCMSGNNLTLLTDLYELTMMQGYFKVNDKNRTVVFDGFYRENPFGNAFAIFCGLEQVVDYIKNLRFSKDDIKYLNNLNIFDKDFLDYLADFKFTGSVYAIKEGSVMFPREPMIKIVAPIIEAQLVETAILNILNHQSLIATKAARVCHAASDGVMEFGLRRAQGPDAGIYGARAAVIGGCIATSNVLAGQMFDIPVMGTHAHSWIMSFDDEYTAFKTYAKMYPQACILLVDTYDTLKSGVPNAIKVFKEMKEKDPNFKNFGIRLDSGDLAYLSKKARKMLDDAGFDEAIIAASNDLDEYLIASLKLQGAKITSWGVGTHLITAKECPSFGGVYKLAAVENEKGEFIPKIKLSENTDKITNPGNKKIIRIYEKDTGKIKADLICLADEVYNENDDITIFDPKEPWKKTTLRSGEYTLREMMIPVFIDGKCVYKSKKTMDIREYTLSELDTLWEETLRLTNPNKVYVDLSQKLYDMKIQILKEMGRG